MDRLLWEMLHDFLDRGAEALKHWNEWAKTFPWKYGEPPHFHEFMGFGKVREIEERYLPAEEQEKYQSSIGLYTPGKDPSLGEKELNVEWR